MRLKVYGTMSFNFNYYFKDLASELRTLDICVGKQSVLNCTTSYKNTQSIIFSESFYGIQKAGTITCGYK